ncbi:regulator of G-protein signaling 22-like [Dendronephthya gigantea]|uniref:regulator of G-protein signaling 22-like n=1 Tax=Dendronephthya gigantea TaxID=151771 RepID=UPI00106953E2|nr:regulator of G-protein signaling 22-like [Dendronephthya gigantea]
MEDFPSELTKDNLEEFLHDDSAFVDYFNTFLALPCFPERIFYNRENDLLEQFTQKLVKDESDNVQLKYDLSSNNVQISYCVTVLERNKALEWLKKYRLPEFIKSGLYAEYKLSKTLSAAQAVYIDTIKNDLSRAIVKRFSKHGLSRSSGDDASSGRHSASEQSEDVFDEFEITSDSLRPSTTVENSEIRDPTNGEGFATKITSGVESEYPRSISENFGQSFPPIIVNKLERMSVQSTGDKANESSEVSENFIGSSSNTTGESRLFVNKEDDGDASLDQPKSNVDTSWYDDVMSDDVMSDDVVVDDVIVGKVTDDNAHTYKSVISRHEGNVLDTKEKPLMIIVTSADDTTDGQLKESLGADEDLKDKTEQCRCFQNSERVENNSRNLCFQEQTNATDMERTNTDSTQENGVAYNNRNIPNTREDSSENITVDEDSLAWENSSFLLKTPSPVLNIIEQDIVAIDRSNDVRMKEPNGDENASLEAKEFVIDTLDVTLQNNVVHNSEIQETTDAATMVNLENLHPDTKLSMVDDQTSIILDDKSGSYKSLDKPLIERTRSQSSIASSDISVSRKSSFADDERDEILENEASLASKAGMDKFKEFLVNTKGEALLLLWLQVETWKNLGSEGNKVRLLQDIKEQFLRNGSPLELPEEIKKRTGKYFTSDLNETQRVITEPLRCYWCPRFTLHHLKSQTSDKHGAKPGPKSIRTAVQPSTSPYHLVRPHSSSPRLTAHTSDPHHEGVPRESPPQASTSRLKLNTSSPRVTPSLSRGKDEKPHARSKSAQSRIITTPCHTNAGKKQLELYATPQLSQYGYQKGPVSVFPPCNDQEYLSSVRLIINPRCKPQARTAWPVRQEDGRNTDDNFFNYQRENGFHESLFESLTYQNESGCFFRKYVSKQNNQLWLNCLSFWQAVMDYTALFENDTLNPADILRKAQWIYARFITSGSVSDIRLDWKTQDDIRSRLDPPFEELFDCVEDHVLACLKEPWDSLCRDERREYNMIPKKETVRYLDVKLKRIQGRSRNPFMQEELESQDGRGQSQQGKYSIEEANQPFPVPHDGISFENVIKDRSELEGFQKYLEKKDPKGVIDLMAWTDMETFQRIPRTIEDKRNKKAKEIRQGYLNSRYFFGPDSPATKEAQSLILSMNGSHRVMKERPSSSVISECQKYVRCRIERRWLALYKASEEYRERQNPKQNVSEVVEDIMLRRRLQRSEAAWRVLNSRWVSSSRDIVALRQTLNNPESCLAFRKFVALKGDTYENDVLFWIEIQKYKDLCHRHASEQAIKKKIQAITDCFIASSIPPELQVDVPIEMAEKLMERITSRNQNIGPYLFREVQMTVFRVLFNMWKDFCSFRSSINDESLLKVLDKRLLQHRAEMKAKKEAQERRKIAKQEAERKKKEKEEKEKKELKSMEQLMSLMSENTSWEQEENDVILWKYSKHISATVEPTSRQKKISTQDDVTSFMELANQRSVATKSTNHLTSSLKSEKNVSKAKRVSSVMADSAVSGYSKASVKGTSSTTSRIPKISKSRRSSRARGMKRNDVMDRNSSDSEKQNIAKNKLLKSRERKKTKKIVDHEILERLSNVDREPTPGDKEGRIKSPAIKEPRIKSRGKDAPSVDSTKTLGDESVVVERPGSLRTSVLRRQWNHSLDRTRSPVPLTSQLLQDFTNSPEGAPLNTPLSLGRISDSDELVATKSSEIFHKVPQITISKTSKEKNLISWRTKRANLRQKEMKQFIPDVIVN